jgi:vacuolar-type H+-ATPase subunit C/Vma6
MFELLTDPNSPLLWGLIIAILAGVIGVVGRPFSSYIRFVYPNAKFEAMGNPYLSLSSLQRLLESPNIDGFIDQLNTDKDYQIAGETSGEIQRTLDKHYHQSIKQMKKDHHKVMNQFFDHIIQSMDAPLIKQAFSFIARNQEIPASLAEEALSESTRLFLQRLQEASKEEQFGIIKTYGFPSSLVSLFEEELPSTLIVDAIVDRHYLEKLTRIRIPKSCRPGLHQYIKHSIDLHTINHLIRAKHLSFDASFCQQLFLGEGYEIARWKFDELCQTDSVSNLIGQLEGTRMYTPLKKILETDDISSSVQPLTDALDRYRLTMIRDISNNHYVSIGPTLRFLVSKQAEITNLKIIGKAIAERLPKDQITPLLITEEHQ